MSKARQLADLLDSNGDVVVGALDNAPDPDLTPYATTTYVDTEIGNVDLSTRVATSGDTMTGDLNFGDNVSAVFGTSSDFKIFHNGDNTYMNDLGTGNLYISTNGAEVSLRKVTGNEAMLIAKPDAEVELYYDNSLKFETTSSGVSVTGTLTATSFSGDGSSLTGVGGGNFTNNGGYSDSMNQGGTDPYSNANQNNSTYKTFTVPAGGMAIVHMGQQTSAYITTRYGTALRVNGRTASGNPALELGGGASLAVVVNTSTSSSQNFTVGSSSNNYLAVGIFTVT